METRTTSNPKSAVQPETSEQRQSKLYQTIMTPIYFVSFLLSLYLVDHQHNKQRAQGHYAEGYLPSWLSHLLWQPHPYQWVDRGPAPPNKNEERWYYHTKQRKLLKMEAAEAFQLRHTVLISLCALAFGVAWLLYRLGAGFWARFVR
ncbi:hypothetical protein F5B20DRAFT_482126 [Whalleya microplaca]|nr:hypothetical protein F5B20DRAFT_482126 [Whalleya microplaca]